MSTLVRIPVKYPTSLFFGRGVNVIVTMVVQNRRYIHYTSWFDKFCTRKLDIEVAYEYAGEKLL